MNKGNEGNKDNKMKNQKIDFNVSRITELRALFKPYLNTQLNRYKI